MDFYNQIEMLSLGKVPTVKIDVPIPTPFFPKWVYWVIGGLVILGGILFFLWLQSDEDNTKNVAEIERLKRENLKQSQMIAQPISLFGGNSNPT
jgi:hypothetical protein